MTPTEKAIRDIRDFCGHHADWWPSTTQVQEMLDLAQPCSTCEALARAVEAEREACCAIVYGQCESDNVAQRTVDAIRARGTT
jgi:hypothetical protein